MKPIGLNIRTSILASCILASALCFTAAAHGDAHCFCQIACQDNTNLHGGSVNGFVQDLGILFTFKGLNPQSDKNQTKCNTMCTNTATAQSKAAVGQNACGKGCADGSAVIAWSKVGTREWKSAQGYGTLHRTPAIVKCTCPAGWVSNTTNVEGGVTADGKCKKAACSHSSIAPMPPNGTPIGTWGFTWADGFWAWGTPANGGAAVCVQTSPATCSL